MQQGPYEQSCVVLQIYLFIALPLQAGFLLTNVWVTTANISTTVLFFLDICFSFVTGFQVGHTLDHIEMRASKVALHYVQTWLPYDIIVSIPWRLVTPWVLKRHWIVDTPEIINAMALISLARFATLKKRSSYITLDHLNIKNSKRSIIYFACFILVRLLALSC